MPFCDKCGAYIPDGETKCLACGFDEAEKARVEKEQAERAAAEAAAAAAAKQQTKANEDKSKYYSFSNEELREKLEEQRRKQKEVSRKWAEQEKQRRAESANESRSFDSEEFREAGEKAKKAISSFSGSTKWLSALSYLGILFVLPFLFAKDNKTAVYHAKQGGVLFLFGIISRVLRFIPLVGLAARLFYYYCIYKGMSNSVNGIKAPLPYIGQLGEKF